jgi:hypothetical protein
MFELLSYIFARKKKKQGKHLVTFFKIGNNGEHKRVKVLLQLSLFLSQTKQRPIKKTH